MDPKATLKRVEGHIRDGKRASGWRAEQHFNEAAEGLEDYWGWRRRGGSEPEKGDDRARKLGIQLSDASEEHREAEASDRAVHQDYDANPKAKKKPGRKRAPAAGYKTRPGAIDEDAEEDALEGSLRWANLATRLKNAL